MVRILACMEDQIFQVKYTIPFHTLLILCKIVGDKMRGPTLQKILYEILKSFEIILISCNFVKHLKLVISKENYPDSYYYNTCKPTFVLESNQTFKFITQHQSAQFKDYMHL